MKNVIFELGSFIGELGRDKVVAIHGVDRRFEMPIDHKAFCSCHMMDRISGKTISFTMQQERVNKRW